MSKRFSEEQKRRANEADLVSLLIRNGQQVKRTGSEYSWLYNGQIVSIKDNLWFHHYDQIGGNTVGFVQHFFGFSYPEALEFILGEEAQPERFASFTKTAVKEVHIKEADFKLPEKNHDMRHVFAYLIKTRGIDTDLVKAFANEGLIYESAKYHNVVFVGKDKDGIPRHAHKRTTIPGKVWRANEQGSDNRFTFNYRGKSDKLYLFEAPIDMLSYISMYCPMWCDDSFIAACSISDNSLNQFLTDRPDIKQVYICFDNDPPGQKAAAGIRQKLLEKGITCEILVPALKDWNEDLLDSAQEEGVSQWQDIT